MTRARLLLALLVAGLALVALSLAQPSQSTDSPPEGWTAEDWNSLSAERQTQELNAYPSTVGQDPTVKAAWVAAHGAEGPDASSIAEAAADPEGQSPSLGVIESGQSPLDPTVYSIRNSWSYLNATQTVLTLVHAGMRRDTSGAVLVVREIPWPTTERAPLVTPVQYLYCQPGPLKITGGTGTTVAFVDRDGTPATFNLTSRTFVPDCPIS